MRGFFNVPVGRFEREPVICRPDQILKASSLLKGTRINCCDFEEAVADADSGDFVYFDPPYIAKHGNNGFREYNEKVFSWNDQERLAGLSLDLRRRGVSVMISNSSSDDVLNLYEGFRKHPVHRHSVISGLPSGRGLVSETILTSYDPPNLQDSPNDWRFN
jgi:DNA adenine methylase